jgi:hypothetical protein
MPNVVFGPQMALTLRLNAISQGPKKSRFPGPIPLPLALVKDLAASKALRTGPYKQLIQYTYSQRRGEVGGDLTRKKVRRAILHKAGQKYQRDRLYLQSINTIKHQ